MPLSRDLVQPRVTGLVELTDEAVIRFGSVEPHQVMKAALATADLYGPVLAIHLSAGIRVRAPPRHA